ncbi:uncharacterized protein LOC122615770 [Drosophila teissieri]|uniref:uncharacterized protein LOC122615770 n=1 Tax=Drosophila teissieri TaxID=7243 RepID=UPI001CBA1E15|nr:uncharacterized protein LOC122615770 [Drosophila teissieri]
MGFIADHTPRVNRTLVSLKFVVYFVITGLTALHILHANKPLVLGLSFSEYRTITILAPFVSILGPLIVGPLADRLAAKNPNTFGKTLRVLTAVCLLISAFIYAFLFAVPKVTRPGVVREPLVSFGCDETGGFLFQERCGSNSSCSRWEQKEGKINLAGCTYSCQNPKLYEPLYVAWLAEVPTPAPSTEQSSEFDYEDEGSTAVTESLRTRRDLESSDPADSAGVEAISGEVPHHRSIRQVKQPPTKVYVQPPHVCLTQRNQNGEDVVKHCHAYTEDTTSVVMDALMGSAISQEEHYDDYEGWCQYPLEGFQCHIPEEQVNYMKHFKHYMQNDSSCKPMIECQVVNPYHEMSVLSDSECKNSTDPTLDTIAIYTTIRLIGDIFPMAALTLLNTAIVIAVRETSEGRGEVCRQYVWGAIGYVFFIAPLDKIFFQQEPNHNAVQGALIVFIVYFVIGAVVLLCASQMPLSPPEWWWHTKTGMLVVPMSAIRRYTPEILVLTLVSILFGTFWSSIHSYLPWTFSDVHAVSYSGVILVLALFFNVDKFIEYCGHSNIFIGGLAIFVIRFTALSDAETKWLTIVMETIEPFVIGLIWITIILYMRHAMPRKLTATGQAIAVLSFFGLGKGFGALIGLARDEWDPRLEFWSCTYQWLAIVACVVALVYFGIYNLILAPRCTAKPQHSEELISGSASQNFGNTGTGNGAGNGTGNGNGAGASLSGNGNGSYSPLRVYHNERGKKGQFRY